jgi:hypothetical protein
MSACREVRKWVTENILEPVTEVITEAQEKCEEVGEWIEENVEQQIEQQVEQAHLEKRLPSTRRSWSLFSRCRRLRNDGPPMSRAKASLTPGTRRRTRFTAALRCRGLGAHAEVRCHDFNGHVERGPEMALSLGASNSFRRSY